MKLKDILTEDIDSRIARQEEIVKRATDRDRGPGGDRGTRETLRREQDELANLKQRKRRESGEMTQAGITIPDAKRQDLHQELHKLWRAKRGAGIPWHFVSGTSPNTVKVIFDGEPEKTSGADGGASIKELKRRARKYV